jgi:protein CpxP
MLTPEQRDVVVGELKRIGGLLNLSDDQRQKLKDFLSEASEKVYEFRQQNPNASQGELVTKIADNRATIRQRLVDILTPDQLSKWDAEVAKAKEFLGHKIAA